LATAGLNFEPAWPAQAQVKRYLRAVVAVGRSARRGEYIVAHFGSGTFYRTDRIGAAAIRVLIHGRSHLEAIARAEAMEPGAGERALFLIDRLGTKGAMQRTYPQLSRGRRWLRRQIAVCAGIGMGVAAPFVRLVPLAILTRMLRSLPSTRTGHRTWQVTRRNVVPGFQSNPATAPKRPNPQRNHLFMYASTLLPAGRLEQLANRVFDVTSVDATAGQIKASGPVVGAFLHSPLCVAVPIVLRTRGCEVIRVVAPSAHGINVSQASGPLGDFFGESTRTYVELSDSNGAMTAVTGSLLRHLKAGRNVCIALDVPAPERQMAAEIEMLGHRFPRNDWPSWLAVRSGRPIALWTTHWSPSGIVLTSSEAIYPDPGLPTDRRVAELSQRLYALAEAAVLEHPEAWTFLGHLQLLKEKRI
jgi:hypothetical protein